MTPEERLEELLTSYEALRARGENVPPEDFCRQYPELRDRFCWEVQLFDKLELAEQWRRTGTSFTIEELCSDYPELLGELRERLALARWFGDDGLAEPDPWQPGVTLEATARFTLIKFLDRGGLGEVFLARDELLQRVVVLKRPQRRAWPLDTPERFRREAEIAGRLEHKGVVPVYASGKDNAGQPFYAMRYVPTQTLAQAIADYHALEEGPKKRLALQRLIQSFLSVCQVTAVAHGQRIAHLDLKPSNIMVGEYDETWVIDWGLAKILGGVEGETDAKPGDATDAAGPHSRGPGLGTVGYMAPEQASGRGPLGPACDVYSLGATLYTLLTNRIPPPSDPVGAAAPVPWPRRLPGDLRALRAICEKAMQPRPDDRYPDAGELAADVQRWQADDRVQAFKQEPFALAAGRRVRRHQVAATLLFTIPWLVIIFLIAITVWVRSEQARTEAQRQRARTNFDIARKTVDRMMTRLGQRDLSGVPHMEQVRREMLDEALAVYQQLRKEQPDDVYARQDVVLASHRAGDLLQQLGRTTEAEQAYRGGLALLLGLSRDFPARPEHRHEMALVRNDLAVLLKAMRRTREAQAEYRAAARLHEQLAAEFPDRPEHRWQWAQTLTNLGLLLGQDREYREAEMLLRQGGDILSGLRERSAENLEYKSVSIQNLNNLALLLKETRRPADAEQVYRRALAIAEDLVAASRKLPRPNPDHRWIRGRLNNNLGALLSRPSGPPGGAPAPARLREAETHFLRAKVEMDGLCTDFPDRLDYCLDLALAENGLGKVQGQLGRPEEGERAYSRSLEAWDRLAGKAPARPEFRYHKAVVHLNLAKLLARQNKRPEAQREVDRAIDILRGLTEKFPKEAAYKDEHVRALDQAAELKAQPNAAERRWDWRR